MSTVATTPRPGPSKVANRDAPRVYQLNSKDRCDRCGESSQAYFRVVLKESGLPLYFCGHHHAEYELSLMSLIDASKTINEYDRLDTGSRLLGSENS